MATSNMYFHNNGTPDKSKLDELKTEISTVCGIIICYGHKKHTKTDARFKSYQ